MKSFPPGFTLIEVLIGMVILAIIGTLTAGSIQATFRTERTVNEKTELQETGTALLYKIREDISQTFYVETQRPLTKFKGEDNLNHDRILFTALVHHPSQPNARESDQAEIVYETETNPEDPHLFLLRRSETPFLRLEEENIPRDFVIVARNLTEFNLEYSDGTTFFPSWDVRSIDRFNKLPQLVKISFVLQDLRGRQETFETLLDMPMAPTVSNLQQNSTSTGPTQPTTTGEAP